VKEEWREEWESGGGGEGEERKKCRGTREWSEFKVRAER